MLMSDDFKIEFTNNAKAIKNILDSDCEQALTDCAQVLRSSVRDLTRVKTGRTKGSFNYFVAKKGGDFVAKVGSPLENAIWEEFGTGEYALEGNGRKGGWAYTNEKGETVFTHGKTPSRALYYAIKNCEGAIKSRLAGIGGAFKK